MQAGNALAFVQLVLLLEVAVQTKDIYNSKQGIYEPDRLKLSMEGYVKTDYNPVWHAWTEVPEWDDIWCEQPIRVSICYSKFVNDESYSHKVRDVADNFLLAKMQRKDGSVHTTYLALSDEFEGSRVEGKTSPYDLGRGQAVFIRQMCDIYGLTGDEKYLETAIKCAEFIVNNWTKVKIGESDLWAYGVNKDDVYTARVTSLGPTIGAFVDLYAYSKDPRWLSQARILGEAILYAQCRDRASMGYGLFSDAIFASGAVDNWWMLNSFSGGLQAVSELYRATRDEKYLTSMENAINGLNRAWKQDFGWGDITPQGPQWTESGMISYGVGRISMPLFTAAYFAKRADWQHLAEQVLSYAWGSNYRGFDHQVKTDEKNLGAYYFTQTDHRYNMECTVEFLQGQIQLYYLDHVAPKLP